MFKFFFCTLLFSITIINASYSSVGAQLFLASHPSSPLSVGSTQPPSPIAYARERTGLLSFTGGVTERSLQRIDNAGASFFVQIEEVSSWPKVEIHEEVKNNKYCKATICFVLCVSIVGGIGAIVTAISHAT